MASRKAASAASPGIASRAILAQDESSWSGNSAAKAGTASSLPQIASLLQAIAFSAEGAADLSTSINFA
jgi:hypothetical protein